MQNRFQIPYLLREWLRPHGLRPLLKWGAALTLAIWLFWPEDAAPPMAPATPAVPRVQPQALQPPQASETSQDIRPQMTAAQTAFLWESFLWMMQQNTARKPVALDGGTFWVVYVQDAPFKKKDGLSCKAFAVKIILGGVYRLYKGIGCEYAAGHWCRQMTGEKAECRGQPPAGFAAQMNASLQEMQWEGEGQLQRFGF